MHKKRILSLFLAVMFIASIAAPVYAGTTTTKTMIREWTVEEVSAEYDKIFAVLEEKFNATVRA